MRQPFRQTADLEFGHAQHLGHFGKGAAGLERRKTADHRDVIRSVFFKNQIHDIIFAVMGEIDIDVRQFVERHPVFVEEAAEIEVEANGANAADFQAITSQRIGRAAAGNPFDAAPPAFAAGYPTSSKNIPRTPTSVMMANSSSSCGLSRT